MPDAPAQTVKQTVNHEVLGPAQLRHPDGSKWSQYPEDVLPLWVAEMDFPVAAPILEALHARLERPLGYPRVSPAGQLIPLLQEKLRSQGLGEVPADSMGFLPGVVPGIYSAVSALTAPGETVVTVTPVYHPFHLSATNLGRKVVGVPLRDSGLRWEMDWDALDAACAGGRLLMLCHPHNPTGRVWDADELRRMRELVLKHDLYVLSDELHADLRFTGQPFEAFAADERVRGRTVTVTGPCKAFNTPGIGMGVMFSHDAGLIRRLQTASVGLTGHPSALGITMWEAALQSGGPWLEETLVYLRANRDFLTAFLHERLPWVKFHPAEATYLAWLDLGDHPQVEANAQDRQSFLVQQAKVALNSGQMFAPEALKPLYRGFVRLNFATPRPLLNEALERLALALGR